MKDVRRAMAFAVLATAGCVYVPVLAPDRPSAQFGSGSGASIKAGRSTRADVQAQFGPPKYTDATDGPVACGYVFQTTIGKLDGLLVTGPCSTFRFGEARIDELDDVWLAFDDQGVLRRIEKDRENPWALSGQQSDDNWHRFIAAVHGKVARRRDRDD